MLWLAWRSLVLRFLLGLRLWKKHCRRSISRTHDIYFDLIYNFVDTASSTFLPGYRKNMGVKSYHIHNHEKWARSPSSALFSHSTNFFICSRNMPFPLARCSSLYHFRIDSSFSTSARKYSNVSLFFFYFLKQPPFIIHSQQRQTHRCMCRCLNN